MQGDKLAAGGKSATFGPPSVTQEKWDAAFKPPESEPVQSLSVQKRKKAQRAK